MKILIDISVLWYHAWYQMVGKNADNETHIELDQFTLNFYFNLDYIRQRFAGHELIFGIDSKEWRSPWYETFVLSHYEIKRNKSKKQWSFEYNDKVWLVDYLEDKDVWKKSIPTVAVRDVLELGNSELWLNFDNGATDAAFVEQNPSIFKHVKDCPEWAGVWDQIKYKGGRHGKWEEQFITPYREFKEKARALTYQLAPLFDAKFVEADWAEYDDIAHAYVGAHSAEGIVIVTTDKDLDQEMLRGIFVKVYDPVFRTWTTKTQRVEEIHMLAKLTGGDSSDNLGNVVVNYETGKKVKKTKEYKFGAIKWENPEDIEVKDGVKAFKFLMKLYDNTDPALCGEDHEAGWAGTIKWLYNHQINESFTKNYTMMNLDMAPETVREACLKAMDEAVVIEPRLTIADVGINVNNARHIAKLAENEALGRQDQRSDRRNMCQE